MALFTKIAGTPLTGTSGNDLILVSDAGVVLSGAIDGGAGSDELRFAGLAGQTLLMPVTFAGVESVVIGTGVAPVADSAANTALNVDASAVLYGLTLAGNAGDNLLTGTAWGDLMRGGAGNGTYVIES